MKKNCVITALVVTYCSWSTPQIIIVHLQCSFAQTGNVLHNIVNNHDGTSIASYMHLNDDRIFGVNYVTPVW